MSKTGYSVDPVAKKGRTDILDVQHTAEMTPNQKNITTMMQLMQIAEGVNHDDIDDMKLRLAQYFKLCADNDLRVGNIGAYTAIGCRGDTIMQWERGYAGPEKQKLAQEIKQICAAFREAQMASGTINPVIGIFWQKNFDGFRDVVEHQNTGASPLGDDTDTRKLAEKYADLPE